MNDILAKSLLNKVERLEAFEERLAVRFENISIKIKDDGKWVQILFELHLNNATTLKKTIFIDCALYDSEGQILGVRTKTVSADRFFGFEIFELDYYEDNLADKISKIKIFPKL